ncbi:MAG: DUF4097 family beta strand repeat-containing protein [Candidatus Omnitrophota bacterium]
MKMLLPILIILGFVAIFWIFQGLGCTAFAFGKEDVIDRSFTVGDGGVLTVDVGFGSIEVNSASGNAVKVKVIRKLNTLSEKKAKEVLADHKIDINQSGNHVSVISESEHQGICSWFKNHNIQVKYIVTIPVKYNLDLKTRGGSIKVGDVEGAVKVKTSGGSLMFGNITGTIDGKTSGGSIQVNKCTGSLRVDTSGGSIDIVEAMETVNAETSGGSISAAITGQPKGDCTLGTSGGSVSVRLAREIKADVDAKTAAGHARIDLNFQGQVDRSRINGKINGGGPMLKIRTAGGSISIKQI